MKKETIKTILVDLDALLDTRLGTISKLNSVVAVNIVNNPEPYYKRQIDDFETLTGGAITNEAFKTLYGQRDKKILEASLVTNIIKLLVTLSEGYAKDIIETPFVEKFVIGINIYPYVFNEEEKVVIKDIITWYCGIDTNVVVVNLPPDKITPTLLKNEWDGFITYDFDGWFTHHVKELDKTPIPRCVVIAPALFIKKPEYKEDVVINGMSAFEITEFSFVSKLSLEYIGAMEFSLLKL